MSRGRGRGFQKGQFLPTQLQGCVLWLRADLGITIGTGVSTWADQSGHGNNATQATGSKQPTLTASDTNLNGAPSLAFRSVNSQFMTLASALPNQPFTVYVAGYTLGGNGQKQFFGDTSNNVTLFINTPTDNYSFFAGTVVQSPVNNQNTGYAFGAIYNGASSQLYIDTPIVPLAQGNIGANNPGGTQILGGEDGASNFLNGNIAEFIVYNTAHSAAQVGQVLNYLCTRYGVVQPPPLSIANCVLWLRADLGVTASSNAVSQWNDYSGAGHTVTQGTSANQPTVNATGGPNNQPYVSFASANAQYMSVSSNVVGTAPWTAFAMVQSNSPSAEQFFLSIGGSSSGMAFGADGVSSARALWYPGAAVLGDGTMTANWEDWAARNDGSNSTLTVEGMAQALTNPTTQPVTPTALTQVGAGIGAGANTWNGGIAELIVYSSALTPSQVSVIESYLSARYGEADIPKQIPGLSMWLRADRGITYVQGPVNAAGTNPPTVTLSGTPTSNVNNIEIDITVGGTLGNAMFTWKWNGTVQQTLLATSATCVLAGTGLTASFGQGTYSTNNVYTSVITISSWADQSGNGNTVTQATAANQPSYLPTGGLLNTPYLTFNGTTQFLQATATPVGGTNMTLAIVHQYVPNAGLQFSVHVGNLNSNGYSFGVQGTNQRDFLTNAVQGAAAGNANPGWEAWLATSSNTGPLQTMTVNGASQAVAPNNSTAIAPTTMVTVGALEASVDLWAGGIAELIIYPSVLSAAQQTQLNNYLQGRYGI